MDDYYISRFELKYRVDRATADAIRSDIADRCFADDHADDGGVYRVHSLYFDTAAHRCYHEKVDGQKIRRKLRFRRYGGVGDRGFLEIKKKIGMNVIKRRHPMTMEDAIGLAAARGESDSGAVLSPDFHYFFSEYFVAPMLQVTYERRALLALHHREVRVTFDTNIAVDWPRDGTSSRFPFSGANDVVLEIKFNHAIPIWLLDVVRAHALKLARISKYCAGLDRLMEESIMLG